MLYDRALVKMKLCDDSGACISIETWNALCTQKAFENDEMQQSNAQRVENMQQLFTSDIEFIYAFISVYIKA